MRHFIALLLAISLCAACNKTDDDVSAANGSGTDSVKSPYPITKRYAGSQMVNDNRSVLNYKSWTALDTTVADTISAIQRDSSTVTFHYAYWEVNDTSALYTPYAYCPPQVRRVTVDRTFSLNSTGSYEDSAHHHTTYYRLSADSLHINKHDSWSSDNFRDILFSERKL